MPKDYNSINDIDEEIEKLKEKRKSIQEKKEQEIGKYFLKTCNLYYVNNKDIFKLIDSNKTIFSSSNAITTSNKNS